MIVGSMAIGGMIKITDCADGSKNIVGFMSDLFGVSVIHGFIRSSETEMVLYKDYTATYLTDEDSRTICLKLHKEEPDFWVGTWNTGHRITNYQDVKFTLF